VTVVWFCRYKRTMQMRVRMQLFVILLHLVTKVEAQQQSSLSQ